MAQVRKLKLKKSASKTGAERWFLENEQYVTRKKIRNELFLGIATGIRYVKFGEFYPGRFSLYFQK